MTKLDELDINTIRSLIAIGKQLNTYSYLSKEAIPRLERNLKPKTKAKAPTFYHKTRGGDKIALEDLSDTHLINILKWQKRKAKEGIVTIYGSGSSYDIACMNYDVEELYGKEALERLNFGTYLKEAIRRNLINL